MNRRTLLLGSAAIPLAAALPAVAVAPVPKLFDFTKYLAENSVAPPDCVVLWSHTTDSGETSRAETLANIARIKEHMAGSGATMVVIGAEALA